MKNNKLKLLICITVITSLFGCANKDIELNQTSIISQDVQKETEPTLKITSEETISFAEPVHGVILYNNGELILRDSNYTEEGESNTITYYKINVDGEQATLEFINEVPRKKDESPYAINWSFIVEELDGNNVRIVSHNKLNGYVIDKELISNNENYYKLIDNILLEQSHSMPNNIINWHDLNNNTSGSVELPYDFIATGYAEVLEDKIIIHGLEDSENNWPVDTLVSIDMKTNQIDKEIKVGPFMESLSINENTVLLRSDNTLDIYDVENKIRKNLIEYTHSSEGPYNRMYYLGEFNDRNKIYFTVSEDKIMKVKVASINNSELDEVITVYEKDFTDENGSSIPNVLFTDDNKELIVFQSNRDNTLTEFKKIKLSK